MAILSGATDHASKVYLRASSGGAKSAFRAMSRVAVELIAPPPIELHLSMAFPVREYHQSGKFQIFPRQRFALPWKEITCPLD